MTANSVEYHHRRNPSYVLHVQAYMPQLQQWKMACLVRQSFHSLDHSIRLTVTVVVVVFVVCVAFVVVVAAVAVLVVHVVAVVAEMCYEHDHS